MPKILIAVSRHPWPPRRGDQARALQTAELLSAEHEVTLLAPGAGPDGVEPARDLPFTLETYPPVSGGSAVWGLVRAFFGRAPLQSGLFRSPALGAVLSRLAPAHDLVILQLVRLAPFLPRVANRPVLVDLVDSLALSTERRADLDRRALRPLLHLEARRLAHWERRLVERSAGALVVSGRDRDAVVRGLADEAAGRVHVVPLAVPPAAAKAGPDDASADGPADAAPILTLTGNLGYFPTREGLGWFLRSVWPLLRARRPDLRLEVAGSRPGRPLRRALERAGAHLSEGPADLAPFLARATVALAPMRGGAGQPMKVVEAWAAGVPVVATSWAAAGTTAEPGEDLLVAEAPEAWCRAVLSLVDDPERRSRVAASARERLRRDYSIEAVRRRLEEAVAGALARPPARPRASAGRDPIRPRSFASAARRKIARLRRLSGGERWLLVRAAAWLLAVDLGLRTLGFVRVRRWLGRGVRRARDPRDSVDRGIVSRESRAEAESIVRLVRTAAGNHLYPMTCLRRSLVVERFLAGRGIPGELRIGVRKGEEGFRAHAWIELGGRPLFEPEEVERRFASLALPPSGVSGRARPGP